MKMMSMTTFTAILVIFAVNAQAHDYRPGRDGGLFYLRNSYSYHSPFPTTSLIGAITYRNHRQHIGLQHRLNNSRLSNQRSYQRAYRNGYRDAQRHYDQESPQARYRASNCYEITYDRHGNRTHHSLPASACRH